MLLLIDSGAYQLISVVVTTVQVTNVVLISTGAVLKLSVLYCLALTLYGHIQFSTEHLSTGYNLTGINSNNNNKSSGVTQGKRAQRESSVSAAHVNMGTKENVYTEQHRGTSKQNTSHTAPTGRTRTFGAKRLRTNPFPLFTFEFQV